MAKLLIIVAAFVIYALALPGCLSLLMRGQLFGQCVG